MKIIIEVLVGHKLRVMSLFQDVQKNVLHQ